jgi:hypothetical protein
MSSSSTAHAFAPTAARLLPVLLIVPIVSVALRWGRPHYLEDVSSAVAFTLLCAGVLGLPALFWALDHGRTSLASLITLGFVTGFLATIVVLATGLLGQLQYGGLRYMRRVVAHGATLPWYGMLAWTPFAGLAGACAIAGGVSGAVYWVLFVHRGQSLIVSLVIAVVIIAAGAAGAALLP